jgi:hypothetical protein
VTDTSVGSETSAVAETTGTRIDAGTNSVTGSSIGTGNGAENRTSAGAEAVAVPEVGGRGAKERGRWWRGFTGSVAAGLAVLAVGVLGVAGVCLLTNAPGPGLFLLVGHPVAAVVALLVQRVADRRNGAVAGVAGVGVLVIAFVALTLFWWA